MTEQEYSELKEIQATFDELNAVLDLIKDSIAALNFNWLDEELCKSDKNSSMSYMEELIKIFEVYDKVEEIIQFNLKGNISSGDFKNFGHIADI